MILAVGFVGLVIEVVFGIGVADQLRPWYAIQVAIVEILIASIKWFTSGDRLFCRTEIQIVLEKKDEILFSFFLAHFGPISSKELISVISNWREIIGSIVKYYTCICKL